MRHHHSRQIIITSVVVPTVGLITLLLCFIIIREFRKKRSQAAVTNHSATISDTQLYVDNKAELEDEERRKHGLDAGVIRHEMEGENRIFEMPGDGDTRMVLALADITHELRGVEHSQELEVPSKI